jgi:hypothetical protein
VYRLFATPAGIEVATPLHFVEPEYYRVPLADTPAGAPFEIDLDSGDVIRRS